MLEEEIRLALVDEMPIEARAFKDEVITGSLARKVEFVSARFERCRFVDCDFTGAGFYQTKLEKCDFSNCTFSGSYWKNSEITECKGNGSRFDKAVFKSVVLSESQLNLANFGGSLFEGSKAEMCSFREAFFSEVKLKKTKFVKSDFTKVDFFRTSLKGMDFSDSVIESIMVSDTYREVAGMKINMFQAAEIAKLLGVTIV